MNKSGATTLLFGMPRSGTTWIGKIFDSHPGSLYRHEPDSQSPITVIPLFPNDDETLYHNAINNLSEFITSMLTVRDTKVCAKLPYFKKKYLNNLQNILLKGSIYTTKNPFIPALQKRLMYSPDYIKKADKIHLIWKSIESLGRLAFLLKTFPHFKGIHIIRHPCGYIASVLNGERKQQFTDSHPSSDDYGIFELLLETPTAGKYDLSVEKLKKMEPIERLAWRWVLYNENTLDACINLDNYTYIFYDNLCKNTLSESRRLFEFSGLSENHQTELFVKSSASSGNQDNDHYYSVYKNPEQASNKWKKQLSQHEVHQIMTIVKQSSLVKYLSLKPI